MIRFSALLVGVATAVLISGVVASSLLLVYVSIAVCAIALFFLAIGVFLHRREIFAADGALLPLGPLDAFPPAQQVQLGSIPLPSGRPAAPAGGPSTGQMAGSAPRSGRETPGETPPREAASREAASRETPPGEAAARGTTGPGTTGRGSAGRASAGRGAHGARPSSRGAPGGRPPARESASGPPSGRPGPRDPARPDAAPRRGPGDPFWQRVNDEIGEAGPRDTGTASRPRTDDPKRPEPTSPEQTRASGQGYGWRPPVRPDPGSRPPAGSGPGSRPPVDSGSGSRSPAGSGSESGSRPPVGSGSGSRPPAGSGSASGSRPPAGSGPESGSRPPVGSGSGSRPSAASGSGPRSAEPRWPEATAWRPPAHETFRESHPATPPSSPAPSSRPSSSRPPGSPPGSPPSPPPPGGQAREPAVLWPPADAWATAGTRRPDTREPAADQDRPANSPDKRERSGPPPVRPEVRTESAAVAEPDLPATAPEPEVAMRPDGAATRTAPPGDAHPGVDAPVDDVRAGVGGQTAAAASTREPEVADEAHVADDKGDDIPARDGRDQPSAQDAGPAGAAAPAAPASPATPEHAGAATPTGRAEQAGNGGSAAHHDPAEKDGSGLADERDDALADERDDARSDERDDARSAGADATGDRPAAAGSGDQPAKTPAIIPTADVTIVPGVARYHRSECILIRFLGPDDLEIMTRQAAEAGGCVPCRACVPDQPSADA
ncbi:MAG: hypothetical protein QOJ73_6094 [Streptosporangiaceae bacterium]|nr:hypothetical protein [Streptosporangiaceae bacterium]